MEKKITATIELMERALAQFKNPAIMWSSGKDSMVMLFILVKWLERQLPVLLFKQPHFQRKYFFAHRIAADWKLELYTPQPQEAFVCSDNGLTEIVYSYNAGSTPIRIPIGRLPHEEHEDWKCGLDMLQTPKAQMDWAWDAVFVGHKNQDDDPLQKDIPIHSDIVAHAGGPSIIFPLREWTDEDVWKFIEERNVPVNTFRYVKEGDRWTGDDKWDSDYHPYCISCLDPKQPKSVFCPKLKAMIEHGHRQQLQRNPISESSYIRK